MFWPMFVTPQVFRVIPPAEAIASVLGTQSHCDICDNIF